MTKQSLLLPLAALGVFNLLQFSTYVLKVPPLYLVCKALLFMVAAGGFLRVLAGGKSKAGMEAKKVYLSAESAEKVAKMLFRKTNFLLTETKSVMLWEDPVKTVYSMVALYFLSFVLRVVPSVLVTFLLVWTLFLYVYLNDFVHKNFLVHLEPYTRSLADLAYKFYNTIPRFKEERVL